MKTRTLACLCIIGLIAVAYVASVSAAAMTLTLPQIEGAAGSTVAVPIEVAGAEKVGALQFEVVYDPAVLEAQGAQAGALASDSMVEVKTDKPGRLFIALITTNSISGSGTVATASFRVIGDTGKTTTLEPAAAAAWEGITHREVLITPVAGQVTVTAAAVRWWPLAVVSAVMLAVLVLAMRKKRA